MFYDNAIAYDPIRRRCDLVFDGTDLAIDATPATRLLIAIGCNRRARPDDVVPQGSVGDFYAPNSLSARQGWVGDALDQTGALIGSRCWLVQGAKATEATRLLAIAAASEATASFPVPVVANAAWIRPGFLGLLVRALKTEIQIPLVTA